MVSLAKTALHKVLSKKAARLKGLVDLLATDLNHAKSRHRPGEQATGCDKAIARGCEAIQTAMY